MITIGRVILMKAKDLATISNGKYEVKNKCIYKGKKEICNFYIKELTLNRHLERTISFTISLKSKSDQCEATIPVCFMNNPSGWLYYEFDPDCFRAYSGKDVFDRTINEIINMMITNGECIDNVDIMGWSKRELNGKTLATNTLFAFGDFDDPSECIYKKFKTKPIDCIREYSKFVDTEISNLLFSYMLLSLLGSFDLLGDNIRPEFVMALTGGNEFTRCKAALFFTNLFKRNLSYKKNDYYMTHVMKTDSFAEIRFKAEYAKDCILIAFEPDKRHIDYLIKDVYGKRGIDEDHPVRSMCLITAEKLDYVDRDVICIHLPQAYSFEKLDEYFNAEDPLHCQEDMLMENISYYITTLTKKMAGNKYYVREKFDEYKNNGYMTDYANNPNDAKEEAAMLLSFAYWLYTEVYYDAPGFETAAEINRTVREIYTVAKELFLIKGTSKVVDFENAKKMCKIVDLFFEKSSYQKKLVKIGDPKVHDDVRIWYDDECLYIRAENIKEFLKMQKINITFNKKIKVALADGNLIKTYTKGSRREYSVHIQKSLYDESKIENEDKSESEDKGIDKGKTKKKTSTKSSVRYIAFDRAICKQHNLFENVEKAIRERYAKGYENE